jgi:hypothetical protein
MTMATGSGGSLGLAALAAAALYLSGSAVPAQGAGLRPRWQPEKDPARGLEPWQDGTRIVLKLVDGAGARAVAGRLEGEAELVELQALLEGQAGLEVEPCFTLEAAELASLRRSGEARGGEELADLSQYFLLRLDHGSDGPWLVRSLLALPVVEDAYGQPRDVRVAGDIVPPVTNDLTGWQTHLARYNFPWASAQPGGTAAGISIADVEGSWNLRGMFGDTITHEDLQGLDSQAPAPAAWDSSTWVNPFPDTHHGTAVLGLLGADVDFNGVDGLVPGATLGVSAAHTTSGWMIANAILLAAKAVGPGGMVLLELQINGPNSGSCGNPQFGYLPLEYLGAEFSAIKQATALGVVVVEAAGNGQQDLDDWSDGSPCLAPGNSSYALFDPNLRSSGALLVGATDSGAFRAWYSNHGRRVDSCAIGESLATLGYGDLFSGGGDVDQFYTSAFGGTSGASPQVTAAAAILLAAQKHYHGVTRYPAHALRLFLRSTGTPTGNPALDRIGEQPELQDQYRLQQTGPRPALVFETNAAPGANLGRTVDGLGDVDGDGFGDVIVSEPVISVGSGQGRAWILSGATGEVWRRHDWGGTTSGTRVARAGDVDNSGFDDYLLSDPLFAPGGLCIVYDGWSGVSPLFFAGTAGEQLGFSADGVGDLNGDGYDDIVMGAPGFNSGQGRVHVRHGGGGGSTLYGPIAGEIGWPGFGHDVAAAGDVNKDGVLDFLASATSNVSLAPGKVYALSGSDGSTIRSWSDATSVNFGHSVAGAGDVDADGFADVLVGIPYYSGIDSVRGRARVYSGRDGSALHTLDGYAAAGRFGWAVDGLGDVNADGASDFLVAAFTEVGPGFQRGAVHVFGGTAGRRLWSYRGEPQSGSDDHFGYAAASAGDIDGDGRGDVIVGAPAWKNQAGRGRAYTYLSPTLERLRRAAGSGAPAPGVSVP